MTLGTPIRTGTWLYGGSAKSRVRILQSDVAFGSGDYEDEPEFAEDRPGDFYYVEWSEAGGTSGGSTVGPFETLMDAEGYVLQHSQGTVAWDGPPTT